MPIHTYKLIELKLLSVLSKEQLFTNASKHKPMHSYKTIFNTKCNLFLKILNSIPTQCFLLNTQWFIVFSQQILEWEATRLHPVVLAVVSGKSPSDLKQALNSMLQTIDALLQKHQYILGVSYKFQTVFEKFLFFFEYYRSLQTDCVLWKGKQHVFAQVKKVIVTFYTSSSSLGFHLSPVRLRISLRTVRSWSACKFFTWKPDDLH